MKVVEVLADWLFSHKYIGFTDGKGCWCADDAEAGLAHCGYIMPCNAIRYVECERTLFCGECNGPDAIGCLQALQYD